MILRNLSPISSGLSRNLVKWAVRLKIPLAGLQPLEKVIIIANGVPDAIVCLILAHKFNGKQFVGILKPLEGLRVGAISSALKIVRSKKVKDILIILDQERDPLEELWRRIERKLSEVVKYEISRVENRFRMYICSHAYYKFRMLIVISGLSTPYSDKHTIEDHLLELSKEVLTKEDVERILRSYRDPKAAWQKLGEKHQAIYSYLLNASKDKLKQFFPQHIKAFSLF